MLLLFAAGAFAQSDVPVDVQARLLNDKIISATKANKPEAMIGYIEQFKKLGSIFPNRLLVIEARAAYQLGDSKRAVSALREYFKVANKGDEGYREAETLWARQDEG